MSAHRLRYHGVNPRLFETGDAARFYPHNPIRVVGWNLLPPGAEFVKTSRPEVLGIRALPERWQLWLEGVSHPVVLPPALFEEFRAFVCEHADQMFAEEERRYQRA